MSDRDDLAVLRSRIAALETRERGRLRLFRAAGYAAAVALLGYAGATFAADGACPNGYPFCFGAGTPALASQVNHNFDQIREWVEQKIGPTGSADVTVAGGKILADEASAAYDVWVQGSTSNTSGGDARNLAMLGLSETSGDQLILNYNGEYGGGTAVQSNLNVSGNLTVGGSLSVTGQSFGCYTRWGAHGCTGGYDEVIRGHTGGFESHAADAGSHFANVECVSDSATVTTQWGSNYFNRLMRAEADQSGMERVHSRCSTCCRNGCYTAFGTSTCATGYTRTYEGRVGGIEAFNGGRPYIKTMCIDVTAPAIGLWSSGYDNRLMRHREVTNSGNSDGMESVTNSCAVCCR
jgi:hypothetical protein